MKDRDELRRRRVRFVATFVVCAGISLALYSFPYAEDGLKERWFIGYLAAYARLTGAVLRLFDSGIHVVGREIVGKVSLTIAKNCDAMDINIVFAAAVVAFPARWRARLIGIGIGSGVLAVVNVLRIASLYGVDAHWPRLFEIVHAEIWPLLLVAIAVVMFLRWSRWAEASDAPG
jgi:exosortase/archaeosortase family protein